MKINFIYRKHCFILAAMVILMVLSVRPVFAYNLDIDTKTTYDIYFGTTGEDKNSVIKDVKVVDLRDIGGKTFLVIESRGFKLKEVRGYVSFDSVSAILPNNKYKVINAIKVNGR